ncbi:MAG: hypothetical protein ABW167_00930 [Baekduia sp.]
MPAPYTLTHVPATDAAAALAAALAAHRESFGGQMDAVIAVVPAGTGPNMASALRQMLASSLPQRAG